jgi:hypothetical protein
MNQKIQQILQEIEKVIVGKNEVVEKILMAVLASGHVLMEDVPGVGKTTTAMTFAKVLGLDTKRVQFTSDTVPSDIIGYSVYDKQTEKFVFKPGAVMTNLFLADEIKEHKVRRIYYAIAQGNFKEDSGTVDAPIGRHPVDRKKMAIIRDPSQKSRSAVTHWSVIERLGKFTLIRCELETGRTHQIRVHMASIGHSLLGDGVYGGGGTSFEAKHKKYISGQCLCATELVLTHPRTREQMRFTVPMPKEFESLCDILRREYFE